jgi:hypothetical protein
MEYEVRTVDFVCPETLVYIMWDNGFSQRRVWRWQPSATLDHVLSLWWWRQYARLKCPRSTSTRLHTSISQKALIFFTWRVKYVKVKQSRNTPTEAKGEYSSYSFTTLAQDGVSGQGHAPAALYSREKDSRHPLDRRLGGHKSRSGHRGWRKTPLASAGDRISIARSSSPSQTLHWLSYHGSPYMMCNLHKLVLGWWNQGGRDGQACRAHGRVDKLI